MSLFAFGCSTVRSTADYPQSQPQVQSHALSQVPAAPATQVINQGEMLFTVLVVLVIIIILVLVFKNDKAKSKDKKRVNTKKRK